MSNLSKILSIFTSNSRLKNAKIQSLTFFYLLILIIFGLWPFNFFQLNNVRLEPSLYLELKPPALLYTETPPEKVSKVKAFTILINLSSPFGGTNGYARIFTYSLDEEHQNFMIGQWSSSLIFKLKADGRAKPIHFEMDDFFKVGARTSVAIVFDGDKLIAYQDGTKRKERTIGPMTFSEWDKSYPLVIGSEANGKFPWEGRIYSIAVFDRALTQEEIMGIIQRQEMLQKAEDLSEGTMSVLQGPGKLPDGLANSKVQNAQQWVGSTKPLICYDFMRSGGAVLKDSGKGMPADLIIPEYFIPYKRTVLQKPNTEWSDFWRNFIDLLINIVGFIPLGFLLAGYLKHKGFRSVAFVLLSVAVGFGISLLIEILQAFLPSRSSDIVDLITNTSGTMIGCLVLMLRGKIL
jgi:hypothetical protein